jgi:hypothetical protein
MKSYMSEWLPTFGQTSILVALEDGELGQQMVRVPII